MQKSAFKNWSPIELLLPLAVFAVLLAFTYGIFFQAPYAGFYFNPTDGKILGVFVKSTTLRIGDRLKSVGPVSWEAYYNDGSQAFFEGARAGQVVDLIVEQDGMGRDVKVPWVFPGFNRVEFTERFLNLWWLSYIFWLFGAAIQLFMRPKDLRWKFTIAFSYLTATWLIVGGLSSWRTWESSLLLHALAWLVLPVYVGLHWVFPKPLGQSRGWAAAWWALLVAGCALALGELWQVFPRSFYLLGFVLAFVVSLILLVIRLIRQPDQRRDVGLLLIAIFIALTPSISLGVIGLLGSIPPVGPVGFLALPFMPTAYFYIVYRRRLGDLELRANRILSIYAFLILLTAALILAVAPFVPSAITPQAAVFISVVTAVLTALGVILVFPTFQAFVERRALGIRLPYERLQATYAARITTSPSLMSLERLLRDELLPSLLVRQFVFLRAQHGSLKVFLNMGVEGESIPNERDFDALTQGLGHYRPSDSPGGVQPFAWARLTLPLKTADETLGYWLFGRRDPDDSYSQAEIPVLQSLADQTAIALSNILQAERLNSIYKADVDRYEQERLRLSRDLHDDVLNQMATLLMETDVQALPDHFKQGYDILTQRVRDIAGGLRPPMLNYGYGLRSAFIVLAENLMERSHDTVRIRVDVESSDERYPDDVEKNLFRIIQQGLENALRHGQAANVRLSGSMDAAGVVLLLEDDGIGFETGPCLDFDGLLAASHFGLAGMFERAALIGARLELDSAPAKGTRIRLTWKAKPLS